MITRRRRLPVLLAALLLAVANSGCASVWHDLQPHRLHRMNRGPGMPSGPDVYSQIDRPAQNLWS